MRKHTMLNRILACGLAAALFVSSPITAFADEISDDVNVETSVENTSEGVADSADSDSAANDSYSEDTSSDEVDQENSDGSVSEDKSSTNNELNKEDSDDKSSNEKVDDEKLTDKEVVDESELTPEELEKLEQEKLEKEKLEKEKLEEEDKEIEYTYTSNGDGTHTKKWVDEDGVEHEEIEDCEFDEDGVCIHCGYKKSEEEKEDQTFTIEIDGYKITAFVPVGAFDEEVEFFAESCELTEDEEEAVVDAIISDEIGAYTAFDIYFKAGDEEVEPNEGYNVKITIENETVDESNEIVHIKDDETVEVIDAEITESAIEFESDSFSKYVITETNQNKILYEDTSYGALVSSVEHVGWGYYGLIVNYRSSDNSSNKKIAPENQERYFFNSKNINLHFYAPENYVISGIYVENSDKGISNVTEANVNVNLSSRKDTNVYIKLSLKSASFSRNPQSTMVNGATLVKYTNDVNAPGNFKFSQGGDGTTGSVYKNALNYGQVYQGIASTSIENGFTIDGGSTGALFPGNADPSYIQKYYKDVAVQFLKDKDGYWTLDSNVYNYTFNQSSKQIKTDGTGSSGFFPFDRSGVNVSWSHDHVHHFGMEIPINFNINANGRVDANNDESEDTIFRFSGDDDVFVYIDNRLVLDLGGIHNAVQGQINFRTGEILVQGHYGKDNTEAGDKTLVSSYDSKVFSHTTGDTYKTVYDLLGTNLETFSKKNHLMTVVYFERGDYDSNCRISYNFDPNRTTTAEFTGMKIDAQTKQGLKGAQFKLYTDPECQVSAGTYAAESEDDGTIRFVGLAKGDYYMKEVAAPTVGNKQYVTPEGAVWKLSVTVADAQENLKATLYAYNDEAKRISLMSDKNTIVGSAEVPVLYIVNDEQYRKLTVKKVVSTSQENSGYNDSNIYGFKLEQAVNGNWIPVSEAIFSMGNFVGSTTQDGIFALRKDQTVVFDKLKPGIYKVTEIAIVNSSEYTLDDFTTNIFNDLDNSQVGTNTREIYLDFVNQDELSVRYENILNYKYDWKIVKKSSSSKKLLEGAIFKLQSKEDANKCYYGKSNTDGIVEWFEDEACKNAATVADGEYELKEIDAPDGYALSTDTWNVFVDRVHGIKAYMSAEGDLDEQTEVIPTSATLVTVQFTFYDDVAYTLPETGGSGVYVYTIGGILLMIAGALLLYKNKNNKKQ